MLIGIDPGKKTGLAAWLPEEDRFQEIRTCTIIQAMRFCQLAIKDGIKLEVCDCGYGPVDRDQHAAINILRQGLPWQPVETGALAQASV